MIWHPCLAPLFSPRIPSSPLAVTPDATEKHEKHKEKREKHTTGEAQAHTGHSVLSGSSHPSHPTPRGDKGRRLWEQQLTMHTPKPQSPQPLTPCLPRRSPSPSRAQSPPSPSWTAARRGWCCAGWTGILWDHCRDRGERGEGGCYRATLYEGNAGGGRGGGSGRKRGQSLRGGGTEVVL